MSLINDALKKAQRQRAEGPADETAAASGSAGTRNATRARPRGANTMVLIGGGAAVLVVLSVVATVYFVNRPSPSAPAAGVSVATTSLPAASAAVVSLPIASAPKPADATSIEPETRIVAAPAGIVPAPVRPADVEPKSDERVAAFVEAIRVAGVRSSGDGSRVLMNDRVYRVNDIVDRGLGIRLVKVDADQLTFSDPQGASYVKNF